MKVILESTDKIVHLNGVPARVWQGRTDDGVECHAFITRIAVDKDADVTQFERELQSHEPPRPELTVYPMRVVL
jgi:hypothetical protein